VCLLTEAAAAAAAWSPADDNCPTVRHWWTADSAAATDAGCERSHQLSTAAAADAATAAAEQYPAGVDDDQPRSFPGNSAVAAAADRRTLHVCS